MIGNTLAERSVLMRFSAGVPGEARKDKRTTDEVEREKSLGKDAGKWIKNLYPPNALEPVKKLQTEARQYHDRVTLPFGCKDDADGVDAISGVGILPAALIAEYADKMREFKGKFERLVEETFLANPQQWIDWAIEAHNGTFDPRNYPGCVENDPLVVAATGKQYGFNPDVFRDKMRKKFYIRSEPLPVPNASHFEASIKALLGSDAATVDMRLADAENEARREVIRRLIAPVKAMADKLSEEPKVGKDGKVKSDIVFRDSLVGNLRDIAELAPKLNITGDPEIEKFVNEVRTLATADADALREDKEARQVAKESAADLFKRLEGYKF